MLNFIFNFNKAIFLKLRKVQIFNLFILSKDSIKTKKIDERIIQVKQQLVRIYRRKELWNGCVPPTDRLDSIIEKIKKKNTLDKTKQRKYRQLLGDILNENVCLYNTYWPDLIEVYRLRHDILCQVVAHAMHEVVPIRDHLFPKVSWNSSTPGTFSAEYLMEYLRIRKESGYNSDMKVDKEQSPTHTFDKFPSIGNDDNIIDNIFFRFVQICNLFVFVKRKRGIEQQFAQINNENILMK
ncbi:hypothetical protein RFI_03943 [Reticulomyxa filosa]|uniref:Uncharacterized protein n=1 Tax=Reticulomyxa filosa TaxID=46433 RepID=X6P501_RETFI|nr:hypothetical protein RFI_03943 [Reticulomyxa filosa]|eukprot:ETO33164.1 hypothetical protein RFI_03943 [Reticulomyxa filosa]